MPSCCFAARYALGKHLVSEKKHSPCHLATSKSKCWHCIDYIVMRQSHKQLHVCVDVEVKQRKLWRFDVSGLKQVVIDGEENKKQSYVEAMLEKGHWSEGWKRSGR